MFLQSHSPFCYVRSLSGIRGGQKGVTVDLKLFYINMYRVYVGEPTLTVTL